YFVFSRDVGGNERSQLYRYDLANGAVTLLTDGKSSNLGGSWSTAGDRIAYMSSRRTGKDLDLWIMDPLDPKRERLVVELVGGGWRVADWSPDDSKLLAHENVSINESYLWLVDAKTGAKTAIAPRDNGKDKVAYSRAGRFTKDGTGIWTTTDKGSEFRR